MLRGRIGGDGAPFNLGEATVSRAAVRLATGEIGFGYTLGRDGEKARMIALCDAMVQSEQFARRGGAKVIAPLRAAMIREAEPQGRGNRGDAGRFLHPGARRGLSHDDDCRTAAGFADKVLSAQSTFRSVMDAMARPGSVQRIAAVSGAPAAMMRGTAAIALTLFDHDTPIWLDARMAATSDVAKWLKFHTSAPVVADSSIAQLCADRRRQTSSGARSLRVRQQRISGSVDDADPAGREPDAGACVRTARPRHRRHRDAAGLDRAARSVRAACDQRHAVSARHRCRAGRMTMPIVAIPRTTRLVSEGRLDACMSPSREANAPSRTPIACWRMSGAATATFPKSRWTRSPSSLSLGVDRVMTEGSLYDRELAALAIKQARGDMIEAIFLVRAFRATLPRFGASRAGRYRRDAGAAADFLDLQGYSRRPDPRAHLRLHPSPAGSRSLPRDLRRKRRRRPKLDRRRRRA